MSNDERARDGGLLRSLDRAQPSEGASDPAPDTQLNVDIAAVLGAVQHLAISLRAMAERIRELEAHVEAFAKSNEELEAANRQLTIEIGEVVQDREALAASLVAEGDRLKRLERHAALAIARATTLNRDLGAARDNLTRIIDAVGSRLVADASASAEDPTTR